MITSSDISTRPAPCQAGRPGTSDRPLTPDSRLAITGATGDLGGMLLRCLAEDGHRPLLSLGRSIAGATLRSRLADRLDADLLPTRWRCANLDLTRSDLGVDAATTHALQNETDIVVHAAADTSLVGDANCDLVNRLGTQRLVELLRRSESPPLLVLVSTAYVVGAAPPSTVHESTGRPADAPHINAYTRSKSAAESIVARSEVPALVVRPSILVDRIAGERDWMAHLASNFAELPAVPLNPDAHVDTVSIDRAARALLNLLRCPSRRHAIYNISAGRRGAITGRDMAEIGTLVRARPDPLRLVDPAAWCPRRFRRTATPVERRARARVAPLLSFLNLDTAFDPGRLRETTDAASLDRSTWLEELRLAVQRHAAV